MKQINDRVPRPIDFARFVPDHLESVKPDQVGTTENYSPRQPDLVA
jgi:hypothetical protein